MKAMQKSLTFLRDQVIYVVPYFQRAYVWDETNWSGIWQELTAQREDCFLGSVILKSEVDNKSELSCKTIIDGQQRLTTLTILLKVMYNYFKEKGAVEKSLERYNALLFYNIERWDEDEEVVEEYCKIEHSRLNRADYERVIKGEISALDIKAKMDAGEPISKICSCFYFFSERIEKATEEQIRQVRNKLTVDKSEILVVIDLEPQENEQVIFDTINSTGVKLTAADIIKNALFQNLKLSDKERDNLYATTWQMHFELNDEMVDSWLETKGIGQNQRSYIDLFFYSFAIIKGFFDVKNDKISDLANKYKEYIRDCSTSKRKEFIEEICVYAKEYRETFIGFDNLSGYTYSDQKNKLMQILNVNKITSFDPFILFAVHNYNEDKQDELFRKLECYVMRHYIIGNTSVMGSFTSDAAEMIKGVFDFDGKLRDSAVSDLELEKALKSIGKNNNKGKLVLFWIELYRHSKPESDLKDVPLNYTYELEHIMPQSWEENWGIDVLPVYDELGNLVPDDTARVIRESAIYQIGNMTLLTSKLNKKLSNRCFADKVNGMKIGRKNQCGIKEFGKLSVTSEILTEPLCWDEQKIKKRTEMLTEEVKQIWPIT